MDRRNFLSGIWKNDVAPGLVITIIIVAFALLLALRYCWKCQLDGCCRFYCFDDQSSLDTFFAFYICAGTRVSKRPNEPLSAKSDDGADS